MHPDWEREIERLEYTKRAIVDNLSIKTSKTIEYSKEMRTINKEMWEEAGPFNGHDSLDRIPSFLQDVNFLKRNVSETAKIKKEINMLERLIISPYFCRIDFKEEGCNAENFYIGIYGLRKPDNTEILIYDWRALVSNMFYDFEPGCASYECPSGLIEGELLLKRQYRIDNGKLIMMFDSAVAIDDSILQDILEGSADNRMKTIVSTIQREQNRAIRCGSKRVLSVQGVAGSGKTSVALHRAAYLLYRNRNVIKAENVRLFTPSGIFAKYISNVLPELGEDDIPCNTLTGLVQSTLGDLFKKYETYTEMMEWQLSQKSIVGTDSRLESISYKSSKMFMTVLEDFAKVFEEKLVRFEDIVVDDTVFSTKEELLELFYHDYSHMPVVKRLSRMETRVMMKIDEYVNQRKKDKAEELADTGEYIDSSEIKVLSHLAVTREMEMTIKKVKSMFSIDIVMLYQKLFKDATIFNSCGGVLSDKALKRTAETLENGVLLYEDQSPILTLMTLLGMLEADKETKHVIIDEAQDYSYITYKLFSKLYPTCGITLLGDASQNINPLSGIGNLQMAGEILDSDSLEYIELDKGYRSTIEIMEFASLMLSSKAKPYGRHGRVPEIMTSASMDGLYDLITNSINDSGREGLSSIAIICRTLSGCRQVYGHFEKKLSVNLIRNGEDEIQKGVVIIPSYLAKGLEFDAVIAVVLSEDEYMLEEDQLFYTVCTRALHRLDICSVKGARILEKLKS